MTAADQGLAVAQYNLGVVYPIGEGVSKDYAKAAEWFRKASVQGDDSDAQSAPGFMYAKGRGVRKNNVKAYAWFHLAAARGVEQAKEAREAIESKMTDMKIAEAQKLSQEYWTTYGPGRQ